MDFRILGPLEVRDGGRRVELGGPRPRALLALLLLDAGSVVSADRLVDELWGEAPPRSAHHLLHVYVSSLRKALGSEEGRARLVTQAPGYVLDASAGEIDALRFERLLGEGRRLLAGGDAERAAETLGKALALWRGSALADFTYEPFAQADIVRLEELRLAALEERIEADLAVGRHLQLVGELESLVAENPFRERLRGQLMLALYRAGRQAEALDIYAETRRVLLDELGIEPGPPLKRLQQAILNQDEELQPHAPAPLAPRVARKLVTVVVAGPTGELDGLDPEARLRTVAESLAAARAVLVRHGATVERLPDERVMGVFGVPAAHEDDALRGARAAVELRDTLGTGIGIETGEAVVEGSSISGDVVARAFRLAEAAGVGEILAGATINRLVRHAALAELDPTREATVLLAVRADAPPLERRPRSPLVGREAELEQLRAEFDRCREERRFRLVTIAGEAGVGKSRLAQELLAGLEGRAAALVGRCLPYGEGITYWPLKEVVERAAGAPTREALLAALPADPDREAIARGVTAAIGPDEPTGTREETFWAFRRLFEALARERPLLLVFEDAHWAEPTLLDLVEYLAERTRDAPVLAVCLARPELLETRPEWKTRTLEGLSPAEADTLLGELLGAAEVAGETRARIVETAEGNPLFLEQLLAMLADEERFPDELLLPLSLRAVLAARLDRLGPAERAVLERASVIGRDVRPDALIALLPEDAHSVVDRHLEALVRRDYLRADGDRLRFAHALIQEATYRGIPKQLRASLHERLGDWIEQLEEADELVGYHLERAFRLREELHEIDWHARRLAVRAAERLGAAGHRALARDDPAAAAGLLRRAVSLVGENEPVRLALVPDLVAALRELPDLVEAEVAADEGVAAAAATGDARTETLVRIERAHVRLMSAREGSVDEAFAEAERAISAFGDPADDLVLGRAWRLTALANRLLGRQSARRAALERALVHARRTADRRTEAWIFDGLGGTHNYGPGSVAELLRFAQESVDWSRENGQRFSEAHGLAQGFGRGYAILGDFEAARRAVAEAREIVEDLGFVWHHAALASAAGFVEMLAGDPVAAERELRDGYELVEQAGMTGSYFSLALREELAEALYVQGRYAEAGDLSEASEREAGKDDVQAQVQWRAVRAKVLAREGRFEEAEALARAAVALVEQTEFVLVHAGAARDLAEVLLLAGRPDEARPALEAALGLYEEKGDRVSAKRMRAMLAEVEESLGSPAATRR